MVGEHTVGTDPDCRRTPVGKFCLPPIQKLQIESVKQHENWNEDDILKGHDIALVRVRGQIQLYVCSISFDNDLTIDQSSF